MSEGDAGEPETSGSSEAPLIFPLPGGLLPSWFGINDELQRMELPEMPLAPPETPPWLFAFDTEARWMYVLNPLFWFGSQTYGFAGGLFLGRTALIASKQSILEEEQPEDCHLGKAGLWQYRGFALDRSEKQNSTRICE